MTPLQLSKRRLEKDGWHVEKVEHWNGFARVRQDLFGFADLIAIKGNDCLLVQTTSAPNLKARVNKILGLQTARLWLESPTRRIVVHGWGKRGEGKRKLWRVNYAQVVMSFQPAMGLTIQPLYVGWLD